MMAKMIYSALAVLLTSTAWLADATSGPIATCPLVNHPDAVVDNPDGSWSPPAGGVLFGLTMKDFDGEERIIFDFDFEGASMKMAIYENRLRIFGRAMARIEVDGEWVPTNLWRINFLYRNTIGDIPDISVLGSDNSYGTFANLATGASYDMFNKANNSGRSFFLSDTHRLTAEDIAELSAGGETPISGAGWVNLVDERDNDYYPFPRDFLFVALGCV